MSNIMKSPAPEANYAYIGNGQMVNTTENDRLGYQLAPQFATEYGLLDKVNFDRGLIESFAVLYPQLRDLDFTTQASKLDVPVYFLIGRDVNAMASLVERYYNVLQAPHKELIWLNSGHGATPEESAGEPRAQADLAWTVMVPGAPHASRTGGMLLRRGYPLLRSKSIAVYRYEATTPFSSQ